MNIRVVQSRNLRRYKRYYLLIALAVVLANTIITGSLFVGDSVKQTLISRVDERLGRTVTLVTSGDGFMDDAFADTPLLKGAAAKVFFTNGFVPHDMSLLPVSVWGVDTGIVAVASQEFVFPAAGEAVINRKTASELSVKEGDYMVVRLPNTRMIPSGSLFVTDNYTASLRLRVKAIIDNKQSGNLNLRNEQTIPFNLFINRQELTSGMEMAGKCNLILLNREVSGKELSAVWKPSFSGIKAEAGDGYREITSERIFLESDLVSRLDEQFPQVNHLFSYLVNDLSAHGQSVPYSFVTAIDRFAGIELKGNDILLSDYAARRLHASIGDTVALSCFVSAELKVLTEEKHSFVVRNILPLQTFQADGRLSAQFPGLHNVENCTDWDSDLPVDMNRITKEDENYWDLYRTTPKALIAYPRGASLWGNNYGVATGVRITGSEAVMPALDKILSPSDAGISVVSPRTAGLAAANGGVDFKSLFLSLAFFVIAAALLLATIPLGGMLHDRHQELRLLQALGYAPGRIRKMLINEVVLITFAATLLGILTAILYNLLVLFALGNIWKGAVHTENFIAGITPVSLMIGSVATLIISFGTMWLTLRRILKREGKPSAHAASAKANGWLPAVCCLLMAVLLIANIAVTQSPVLFMITGLAGLTAAISGYAYIINRRALKPGLLSRRDVLYKNLNDRRRSGIISVAALAAGLFVVLVVGLNRKNFSDTSRLLSGTGGFALWGENAVPLHHSLSTPEGRERFGLSGLPAHTSILQFYRHGGDDASCLNLNRAPQPTVLGVDAGRLAGASFTFAATTDGQPADKTVWDALSRKRGDYYPVIADQTVLQWGLMKSVGDTITYLNRKGEPVVLQFIGGLNTSVFQGNLLMDKAFFTEIWGGGGSEVMLVQTPDSAQQAVKQLLSQALADYGLKLDSCNERLKEFNSVTDSYLTIFLMLGGLGLLIGLFGMMLIIRRGLLNRAGEVSTLSAIGFDKTLIVKQLFRESLTVPLYAIAAGTVSALVAVASAIPAVSPLTWITMSAILLLLIIIAYFYCKRIAF
jgi:putative ABC transport system permease protein